MYRLQIILVPPSARDNLVPGNLRFSSVDSSQMMMMMPNQNMNQQGNQQGMEPNDQLQNIPMNGDNTMNYNSSFMTAPLYQAPLNTKKFLHFTKPTNSLFTLSEEIQKKCEKMYPNLNESIDILSIQDSTECDLDPDFTVKDVFNMDNVVRVILNSELESDDNSNTSLYQSNKRRKLNEGRAQAAQSAPQQNPAQQNSILNVVKKRSGVTNTTKPAVNNNLRISTPLANQIYPLNNHIKVSNNSDDEEDVAERSFLPPPNQPQSPPIRISSGIDNYKRIRTTVEDTVSRSEMVDPDKSKQQRMFSGTPIRTMMTPNRVTLTGQRVMSENLGNDAPSTQGLVFASTNTARLPSKTLSPIFTPRIASGSLSIPEPRISEVEKELREGPESPSSVLPPKPSRIPMKKPYIEKSPTPDTDSSTDTDDELRNGASPSFINDNSSTKGSPFNQPSSSQAEITALAEPIKNVKRYRGLTDSNLTRMNSSTKRKSSLETKLQNKSFSTFIQNGKEDEFRRMDHFSDEDDDEEVNSKSANITKDTRSNSTNDNDENINYDANDTVHHIELPKKGTQKDSQNIISHPSLHKKDLLNMVSGTSPVDLIHEKNNTLHKPFSADTFSNEEEQVDKTIDDNTRKVENDTTKKNENTDAAANDDSLLIDTEPTVPQKIISGRTSGAQEADLYSLFLQRQSQGRQSVRNASVRSNAPNDDMTVAQKSKAIDTVSSQDSNIVVSQEPANDITTTKVEDKNSNIQEKKSVLTENNMKPLPKPTLVTHRVAGVQPSDRQMTRRIIKSKLPPALRGTTEMVTKKAAPAKTSDVRKTTSEQNAKNTILNKLDKSIIEKTSTETNKVIDGPSQGNIKENKSGDVKEVDNKASPAVPITKNVSVASLITAETDKPEPPKNVIVNATQKKDHTEPAPNVAKKNLVTSKQVMELANTPVVEEKTSEKTNPTAKEMPISKTELTIKKAAEKPKREISKKIDKNADISSIQLIRGRTDKNKGVSALISSSSDSSSESESESETDEEPKEEKRNIVVQSFSQPQTKKPTANKKKVESGKIPTKKSETASQKKEEKTNILTKKETKAEHAFVENNGMIGPELATPVVANKVPELVSTQPRDKLKTTAANPMPRKKPDSDNDSDFSPDTTSSSSSSDYSSDENRNINLLKSQSSKSKLPANRPIRNDLPRVIPGHAKPIRQNIYLTPEFLESDSDSDVDMESDEKETTKPKETAKPKKVTKPKETAKLKKTVKPEETAKPKETVKPKVAVKPTVNKSDDIVETKPIPTPKMAPLSSTTKDTSDERSSESDSPSSKSSSASSSDSDSSSSSSDEEESHSARKSRRKIVTPPKGKVNSRVPSQKNSNDSLFKESEMVTSTQRENTTKPTAKPVTSTQVEKPVADLPKKIRPSLISLSDLASRGIPDVKEKSKSNNDSAGNTLAGAKKAVQVADTESESSSSESSIDSEDSGKSSSDSGSDSDSDSDSDSSDSSSSSDDEESFISAKSASAALGKKKKKMSGGFASLLKQSKKK
ncbi:hypothetical protein C6P45_003821 [Maudiozyma exigua]|uniref:Nucleolar protein Dnt1-like N-terminal domain-containing protein n=1 Tax=Maudiozyma exigua TaxID=34358 RepID=A0A9P7BC17_MAUEX|nr:hypothetical protein C6P45_003821 [Kazachstania exigua]